MYIAVDFDGTCVTHDYPRVGHDIDAARWLLFAVRRGAKLILYTMRDGQELIDAVAWFRARGIELFGVNENPDWSTDSPKVYAHLYVDDAALGIPLIRPFDGRPYIDWSRAGPDLLAKIAMWVKSQ